MRRCEDVWLRTVKRSGGGGCIFWKKKNREYHIQRRKFRHASYFNALINTSPDSCPYHWDDFIMMKRIFHSICACCISYNGTLVMVVSSGVKDIYLFISFSYHIRYNISNRDFWYDIISKEILRYDIWYNISFWLEIHIISISFTVVNISAHLTL